MAAIVKTVNGLALASVKTFNGLAAASLKTINGQDASAAPAGGDITADLWQNFEFDTISTANLAAADSGPRSGSATYEYVTGGWSIATNAERATLSTVNTGADTGTRGLVCDNNTGAGSIRLDLNTYPTTQSAGIWFHVTALSTNSSCYLYDCGEGGVANSVCSVQFQNVSGTVTCVLIGATTSSTIAVSTGTTYWLTVKTVRNGTCSMAIYDTSGAQVGSTVTCTGRDVNMYYHELLGLTSSSTGERRWDDLVVDYTDATFPLGP